MSFPTFSLVLVTSKSAFEDRGNISPSFGWIGHLMVRRNTHLTFYAELLIDFWTKNNFGIGPVISRWADD